MTQADWLKEADERIRELELIIREAQKLGLLNNVHMAARLEDVAAEVRHAIESARGV